MTHSTPVAGRYLLGEQLGAGAMGTVHAAWDLRARREVAVKVLRHPPGGGHGEVLLRFVREQSLRVEHPHVLAPHGWAADDDQVLLVMDLVRGGSLEGLLRRGPLPETYVAALLAQLLAGLAAVHAAGVVHRDVKPANLLLEPTGRDRPHLRLADFGVAAVLADRVRLTRAPGGIGTDGFIAPECAAGAGPDPRQDLWAAAVVARHALGPGRPGRSWRLDTVLDALACADPDDRPPTADAALSRLRALVDLDAPWDPVGAPDVRDTLAPTATPAAPAAPASREPVAGGRVGRLATACLRGSVALSGAGALAAGAAGRWP